MRKTKAQIQKEFNTFATKVAKLESLKHELQALDVKGFDSEVQLIKTRLKDINAIPSITKDIESLRNKIKKKEEVVVHDSGLKRRISHLESLIEHKKRSAKQLSGEEVSSVKAIPRLVKEIPSLEMELEKLKMGARKQLSGREVDYVKDIPNLEGELARLKKSFGQHVTTKSKVKVDSGVGILVDEKFDDFIRELKANLTERLKEEEQLLEDEENVRLMADLANREKMFESKAIELENKKKEETASLKSSLYKAREEFAEKAEEFEKKKDEAIATKNEFELKKKKLSGKAAELESKEKAAELKLREDLEKRKIVFAERYANLVKKAHEDYRKKVESELESEVKRRFNEKLKEKIGTMKASVIEITRKKALASLINQNKKVLEVEKKNVKQELGAKERENLAIAKQKMHDEMIAQVEREAKKKEQSIRRQLEIEYKKKLSTEVKAKQAELDKKKAQIEQYVQQQAKRLFK